MCRATRISRTSFAKLVPQISERTCNPAGACFGIEFHRPTTRALRHAAEVQRGLNLNTQGHARATTLGQPFSFRRA
jgi:hypothetical protein